MEAENKDLEPEPPSEEFIKNLNRAFTTQGRGKLWNYFVKITKTKPFREMIKSLRKRYDIPETGFTHLENITLPPEDWNLRFTPKSRQLDKELKGICENHNLHFLYWSETIKYLLFYNELDHFDETDTGPDLCCFTDLKEEHDDPFSKEMQEADDFAYPIAVRISPYASQRDITDFVEKNYGLFIKPWQEKYIKKGVEIAKVKKKNQKIQERNDFIFENRRRGDVFTPYRELAKMVQEKFGGNLMDYAYIGKIIAIERKKEKKCNTDFFWIPLVSIYLK